MPRAGKPVTRPTTNDGRAWCTRCHHLLRSSPGGWVHVSEDDWSGSDCYCAVHLVPCNQLAKRTRKKLEELDRVPVNGILTEFGVQWVEAQLRSLGLPSTSDVKGERDGQHGE